MHALRDCCAEPHFHISSFLRDPNRSVPFRPNIQHARGNRQTGRQLGRNPSLCDQIKRNNDRPRTPTLEWGLMFKVASWNLNSVRSRLTHVTTWLEAREPDVLLLQELKGTEFPSDAFKSVGYESVAVTQKAYNGVAICRDIR
jgi:hypothetical protein